MDQLQPRVHSNAVYVATKEALLRRGVTIQEIANIVFEMQIAYNIGLTIEHCIESVESVLKKREMQHGCKIFPKNFRIRKFA